MQVMLLGPDESSDKNAEVFITATVSKNESSVQVTLACADDACVWRLVTRLMAGVREAHVPTKEGGTDTVQ
eukprot:1490336-Rhodomonas_salina.2